MNTHRCFTLVAAAGCILLCSAMLYISETQAIVQSGLADLKFEAVRQQGGLIGAPGRFRVTHDTLDHLRMLMDHGKIVTVEADGRIVVIDGTLEAEAGADE